MNLLLDTCAFLWLAASPNAISAAAAAEINNALNSLWLSDVSVWEIATKYRVGKLPLPASPRVWLPAQVNFFQVRYLPIKREAILLSGELPLVHRDPFDRLLSAQAQSEGMSVITPDTPFSKLGAKTIW